MAEPLKNLYNRTFFNELSSVLKQVIPDFDEELFLESIYDSEWDQRELKDRMKHIAVTLHSFLPDEYEEALNRITKMIPLIRDSKLADCRLEFMFLPEYVERYGLKYFESSTAAMKNITQFTSCEFAVRPFIEKYPVKMMGKMVEWSTHENHHVRRLASEGCRPRLPWAMALPKFKKNPEPVLPILENLKNDYSLYVRRSVANNLNDIAKDHSGLVIEIGKRWKGKSDKTDWIVKHGCRTLLKQAHPEALKIFGFHEPDDVKLNDFGVDKSVKIGEKLNFRVQLENCGKSKMKLRIEYGIDYKKANGSHNRKIFKITENSYQPGEKISFHRSQSFRNMTTRKHYPGEHSIALIVNGKELAVREFMLVP